MPGKSLKSWPFRRCPSSPSQPERLGRFLAETGLGPETLRNAAADPQFLAGVLDFVLRDDATVKAFADGARNSTRPRWRRRCQALEDTPWERDVP